MKSCDTLFKTITRLDAVVDSTPDKAGKAACATAWLYTQVDWFDDIIGLLEVVKDQAAVAASPSSSVASRRIATDAITLVGQVTVSHVKQACKMTRYLQAYGSTAADTALADMVAARLAQRSFMQATADWARGMLSVTLTLNSQSAMQELTGRTFNAAGTAGRMDVLLSTVAVAVCLYLELVTDTLHTRLQRVQEQGGASSSRPSVPPAVVTQIVDSMKESQLLAAAAAALVDSPNVLTAAGLTEAGRGVVCAARRCAGRPRHCARRCTGWGCCRTCWPSPGARRGGGWRPAPCACCSIRLCDGYRWGCWTCSR